MRETRRSFLGGVLGATLATGFTGIVGAALAYLFPSGETVFSQSRVRVGRSEDLPVGAGRMALVDDEPVWIVNLASGPAALSALCTHRGCIVQWEEKRRVFRCPCHEGHFDERGNVVSGLPRRPLVHFDVAEVGGDLYVSRRDERLA
jgi:cytochrome b6-f complex iron-sulfur subunit